MKNLCIANSQQYLCIAQLTIYSEAVPTADVGQQDGVAPTELEGLRYEVNVKFHSHAVHKTSSGSQHVPQSKCSLSANPQGLKSAF